MDISPNTDTPISIGGRRMVSELFVSIGHLINSKTLVNDYSASLNLHMERREFCGLFEVFLYVVVYKLLVGKISTF